MRRIAQPPEAQLLAERLEFTPRYSAPPEIPQARAYWHVEAEGGQVAVEQCVVKFLSQDALKS